MARRKTKRSYADGGTVGLQPPVSPALETRHAPILQLTGTQAAGATTPPGLDSTAAITPQPLQPEELLQQQPLPSQAPVAAAPGIDTTGQQALPTTVPSQVYSAQQSLADVGEMSAATQTAPVSQVTAAQGDIPAEGLSTAQQAEAAQVQPPAPRQLNNAELIDAAKVTDIGGPAEAVAQTIETPEEATVQFQLTKLMDQFEGGALPAFAAPAIRKANAVMAQRGLSASSMAGQAIMQAAMESSIPIAMQDAQIHGQFAQSNLSNKQQAAVVNAQIRAQLQGQELSNLQAARVSNASRITEINNMNFTAEQQIAMENAQLSQNMRITNLNNKQQSALQNALTLSQRDTANLNNRQTAAVENARALLNTDLTLLSNRQQARQLSFQAQQQTLLSDQAAVNASRQFNASSQNQVEQFFQTLGNNVQQANLSRVQANRQFVSNQEAAINQFNSGLVDGREKFNTQASLQIAQSNALWRRALNTQANELQNRAAEQDVARLFGLTSAAQANLWQLYRDESSHAITVSENQRQRNHQLAMAAFSRDFSEDMYETQMQDNVMAAVGGGAFDLLQGLAGNKSLMQAFAGIG